MKDRKNMLYLTPINSNTISVGIWKKILMQVNFFKNSGFDVKLIDTGYNNETISKKIGKRLPMQSINNWKIGEGLITEADVIYIRYSKADFGLINFLKRVKKINEKIKILIEIPTYPYDGEEKITLSNSTILLRDKYYRLKLKKYCNRILTYSDDDVIWGIKTINLSNVVDFHKIKPLNVRKNINRNEIHIIGVATLSLWHGYDRFIEGLYNYYKQNKGRNIKFHIVGDGPEYETYKNMINQLHLEDCIKLHGRLEGEELDQIYNISSLGVDALGRHRSGVEYNSSLKGKEYGAKGLPIISAVKTDLDKYPNFKYYLKVNANEEPIDIDEVLKFHNEIYKNKTQETVVNEIRDFNKNEFNIERIWKKVIDYI